MSDYTGAKPHPAVTAALAALAKRKGPATDDDRPPFQGISEIKPVPILPGQLDIYGNEMDGTP